MIGAIMIGGPLMLFINVQGLMIVVGGTFGCILSNYSFKEVLGAFTILRKAFLHKETQYNKAIKQLIGLSTKARKEGILSLQSAMDNINDEFLVKGLQMAVDGQEPESLKAVLYQEIEKLEERHEDGADIFTTMATYAPALGLIGTLIGLVQMLSAMDDPKKIGPAMAVALLTTLYGAIIANAFALPIADKLSHRSQEERLNKALILETIGSIQEGLNPRVMEELLKTYLPAGKRDESDGEQADAA
jgi:chemotaxis protein MotA